MESDVDRGGVRMEIGLRFSPTPPPVIYFFTFVCTTKVQGALFFFFFFSFLFFFGPSLFSFVFSLMVTVLTLHLLRGLMQVALKGATLETELTVTNTGSDAFDFQTALHSYFRCSDINKVGALGPFFFFSFFFCFVFPLPPPSFFGRNMSFWFFFFVWMVSAVTVSQLTSFRAYRNL